MDQLLFKCNVCDKSFNSLKSIAKHSSRIHKIPSKETYTRIVLNGQAPTCKCGCGETTKYWDISRGYSEFRPGHQARVHNNWGHNPKAIAKSREAILAMRERGEFIVWNKGLTVETDERVAAYGRTQSKNITIEERKIRSIRMSINRKKRIIPTLYGKDHSQWKGGISSLQPLCRARLYSRWVYPKLKAGNFTCHKCSSQKNLCVHHDDERFSTILQKAIVFFGEPGDDHVKRSEIAEWIVQYHLDNDVSGMVLCEDCHKLAHQRIENVNLSEHI